MVFQKIRDTKGVEKLKELDRSPESRARFGAKLGNSPVYDEINRRQEEAKKKQKQMLENFKQALNKKRDSL